MVFSSSFFVFAFLPLALLLYFAAPAGPGMSSCSR